MVDVGTLPFGTMCSGAEIPVICMTTLYNIRFPGEEPGASMKVLYGCEKENANDHGRST